MHPLRVLLRTGRLGKRLPGRRNVPRIVDPPPLGLRSFFSESSLFCFIELPGQFASVKNSSAASSISFCFTGPPGFIGLSGLISFR
jgi:hypothetical protein